jgi:hypothetical protein
VVAAAADYNLSWKNASRLKRDCDVDVGFYLVGRLHR